MTYLGKGCRLLRFILAASVALVTLTVMVDALVTVKTGNAATFSYALAPGQDTAPVVAPVASQGILLTGVQNTVGFRGVGRVALLDVPGSFLEWVGLESPSSAAITSGFSSTPGTHIVYLDFSHVVDIRVANADAFLVHNAGGVTATGVVTMVW